MVIDREQCRPVLAPLLIPALLLGMALGAATDVTADPLAAQQGFVDRSQRDNHPGEGGLDGFAANTNSGNRATFANQAGQTGDTDGTRDTDHAKDNDHNGGGGNDAFHLENLAKLFMANIWGKDTAYRLKNWIDPIFSLTVALLIALFFISVGRDLRDRDPSRKQIAAEMIVGGLYGLFRGILGDHARRYAPYLGTLFLFIFCNNLFGLIPLGHSSTSSFVNTTLGLGFCTFLYVQYVGIRQNGLGGYLYHFAGQPKSTVEWGFALLIFPLEVMGELIKPLSLSLRLFGNIFGEETLIAVMVILGTQLMQHLVASLGAGPLGAWLPGVPVHVPFYAIGLIGSTVQALVFTLLSTIYISLMLPHDHDEEAHDEPEPAAMPARKR